MKRVTIRGIPDEVKKTVQKQAERKGMSRKYSTTQLEILHQLRK